MNSKYLYREHVYALIMAGGGGTRLWPVSRDAHPKQFLNLFGEDTLIQITGRRLNKFLPWEKIYVSTATPDYAKRIKQLLPDVPSENIIIEPIRRDSGPAHGLGACYIYKKDPEAVIINAASDHLVTPEKNYRDTMYAACNIAWNKKVLLAIGIKPTYPHTGMGHMKMGKKVTSVESRPVYKLMRFVEKPPLPLAKRYTSSGKYYWNANHYVWRADSFLAALETHAPEIYGGLSKVLESIGTKQEKEVLATEFEAMPKISVDYAVSEKAKNFQMMVADYSWTDIGDWNEVWKNSEKDEAGNVVVDGTGNGDLIELNATDTYVYKNGRTVALIDVDNLVVIDTKDALLICNRSRSQRVKEVVEFLKKENRKELL